MSFKFLTKLVAQIYGKVPLRITLIVPFVVQIFGVVSVVGYISMRNGQRAVNDVVTQLLNEQVARVEQSLQAYLHVPHQVNQINAAAIRNGQLDLENTSQLENYFWQQLQIFDVLTFTGLGLESKVNLGAERFDNDTLTVRVSTQESNYIFETYSTNQFGERVELLSSIKFNPRTRPWYKAAVASGQPIWSEIYPNTAGITAYLGASMPFYNQQGKLQGVLLTNINLSQIGDFLGGLRIGKTGQVFIIERSGMLVATSTGEKPFHTMNKAYGAKRVKATESQNDLTKATAKYLAKEFNFNKSINSQQYLEFKFDGQREFINVKPFQDKYGLDWLIVVVIPETDFLEQIYQQTKITIVLCLLALLLATAIGVLTSRWLVQPILQLKDAATALSEGEFNQIINLQREDEVGVLGKAFNSMAFQLRNSFDILKTKNEQLERLDKLKDEFLANTSHELRTPLNGIIGIAESLIDGAAGKLPSQVKTNLSIIATSGRRLSNLINDILDFSKLKHRNIELQIKPVGIRELTEIVLTLSRPMIGKKSLQLINSISHDMPFVDADENRLQQIFYNLIGNAIKFTESGTVEVSAKLLENQEIESTNQLSLLEITIADTGIGIPEDKLERVFESFEQADGSTAREYGGTGLGLAITKKLVELHGGNLSVSSVVGVGSKFKFTLPISQNKTVDFPQLSCPLPISLITELGQKNQDIALEGLVAESGDFKILIVDDEPVNLQVIRNNLALQNYAITQANNGIEALEIIENGLIPDLILLDVMMPHMTGYEVTKKLREKFLQSELPIVMLTAKPLISDLVEGFLSGANDYLTKPFSKPELLARIKTHIRLAKINAAYGRFVPHSFLHFLKRESIVDVKLGDNVKKKMSILFSDIRSFTTLSETMTPEENFKFINAYLSRMEPAILDNEGFIDKYIGDAIMALFGRRADDAVSAGINMLKSLNLYNQERQKIQQQPIKIGIGINTGNLMLGTVGGGKRIDGTVISDAVNLASRLENLTKFYGANILISGNTLFDLEEFDKYNYRFLDRVKVKGKKEAVAVFEILDGDTEAQKQLKIQTKTEFEEAILLYYQQKYSAAKEIFLNIFHINPEDKVVKLYLKRCKKSQIYGIPEEWKKEIFNN
ncbi:MAG: response regulator [Okeania sp. SIO3B5]|uniref:ATP-binding protein n=1 Tax=Okeania sp. SIO3B5 TaxID=2607811 RepID=UPI0014018951|nr:ATP-binding protein [Okeania sp. SIO3B5]NEO52960.1 response regulator [Okeania sp. SIO3B5]